MIAQVVFALATLLGGFWMARSVVRVHREITASQEATERGLRAEADRRRREAAR